MKARRFPELIPEDARTKSAGTSISPETFILTGRQLGLTNKPGNSSSRPGPVEHRKSSEGGKPHSPESLPHPDSCTGHGEVPNTGSSDMRLLRCCPSPVNRPGTGATDLPKLTLCTDLGVTLSSLAAFMNRTL